MTEKIKLAFNGEVKKTQKPHNYQSLIDQTAKAFKLEIGLTLRFYYIDDSESEAEEITISNDDDLSEAFSFQDEVHPKTSLKIFAKVCDAISSVPHSDNLQESRYENFMEDRQPHPAQNPLAQTS